MQAPDTIFAPTKTRASSEVVTYGVDFTRLLKGAELLTPGQVLVPQINLSGLTIVSIAVNASTFVDDYGNTVAVQKGVLIEISGGTPGLTYEVLIPATTTATPSNTRTGGIRFFIER